MMLKHKKILYKLGEEYIKERGNLWLTVISGSMKPLIQIGDKVLVKSVKYEEIKRGDIVIFKEGDIPFSTHRVIDIRRKNNKCYYLEKGDQNITGTWIREESIIGQVIAIKRKDGRVIQVKMNTNILMKMNTTLLVIFLMITHAISTIAKIISRCAKKAKVFTILKRPYRHFLGIITRGSYIINKGLVFLFIKGMKFYG